MAVEVYACQEVYESHKILSPYILELKNSTELTYNVDNLDFIHIFHHSFKNWDNEMLNLLDRFLF